MGLYLYTTLWSYLLGRGKRRSVQDLILGYYSICHGQESVVKTPNLQAHSTTTLGSHWQSEGSFLQESQANLNSVMFEHLFPLGRRKKEVQRVNQNLTNKQAFDNSPCCPFIFLLWRVCWLMSPSLILLFWNMMSDISPLQFFLQ